MSTDENHRQSHMTLTARKICGVFATSSFNFGPPTYFISHFCGGALHAVFHRRYFFLKKGEQSCLTMVLRKSCQRAHMLHGVHGVDTMFMFCLLGFL